MPPVHFTPAAGLRDELGNEAGGYGRGWSCLQAVELMFCETLTYRAEGVIASLNHPLIPTDQK